MAIYLTNILQSMYKYLGQTTITTATGGSGTTAIDTKLQDIYDDDFAKGGALFVVRDAAGLGASPEGKFGAITAFDQSTSTFTFTPTMTDSIAAGDTIMWTTGLFPLFDMIEMVNEGLKYIGKIPYIDTSITTVAQQTEYTLPAAVGGARPSQIFFQSDVNDADSNKYVEFQNYQIVPNTAGSQWTLVVPQFEAGHKLQIWYDIPHPVLSVYNSEISSGIPQKILSTVAVAMALQWYNRKTGGTDDFWREAEDKAWREYDRACAETPIWRPRKSPETINLGQWETVDGVASPIT